MSRDRDRKAQRLQRKLDRLSAALEPRDTRHTQRELRRQQHRSRPARTLVTVGLALGAASLVMHQHGLFTPALILLIIGGALALRDAGAGPGKRHGAAHVGLGATVADDAVVEPGAVVEMGATVKSGATVHAGALVRMGATVNEGAVIEPGAVVGWGATVGAGARVGRSAVIGAGATVNAEAVVPADARLLPGATWARGELPPPASSRQEPPDPRAARIASACSRIETELAQASPAIREHLGGSAQVAASLRATCDELMSRERALRDESAPQALAFLQQEQAELERRIAATSDEKVRASLQSAVAAIEDQRRQRALLAASADRIDAELTRLSWTLDGMAAQLVRLRTAGASASAAPGDGMTEAVQQLHDEIDAISDALEEVSAAPSAARERA